MYHNLSHSFVELYVTDNADITVLSAKIQIVNHILHQLSPLCHPGDAGLTEGCLMGTENTPGWDTGTKHDLELLSTWEINIEESQWT